MDGGINGQKEPSSKKLASSLGEGHASLLVHRTGFIALGRIMTLLGTIMAHGNGYRCQGDKG